MFLIIESLIYIFRVYDVKCIIFYVEIGFFRIMCKILRVCYVYYFFRRKDGFLYLKLLGLVLYDFIWLKLIELEIGVKSNC